MMKIELTGNFKMNLLMDQILLAFPEFFIEDGIDPFGQPNFKCLLTIISSNNGVILEVPDTTDIEKLNSIVVLHDPKILTKDELLGDQTKKANAIYQSLPKWVKTWTPQEASDYIHSQIFSGATTTVINANIDSTVTTIAGARTALKSAAASIVALRDICEKQGALILVIRDILMLKKG